MVERFTIQNFKSIVNTTAELGQFTVLIGENGSGKSNILEAFAFASAAISDRLSYEFMASRGIRWAPQFMRPAFTGAPSGPIAFDFRAEGLDVVVQSALEDQAEPWSWKTTLQFDGGEAHVPANSLEKVGSQLRRDVDGLLKRAESIPPEEDFHSRLERLVEQLNFYDEQVKRVVVETPETSSLEDFIVYAPENTALRTFEAEGQIWPLGIRGEGLFAYLKRLSQTEVGQALLKTLADDLKVINWFRDFEIPEDLGAGERRLHIADRFFAPEAKPFDQRTANEGFLLLLFYFTLLRSPKTPNFMAIDNVDGALNPKLCTELTRRLAQICRETGKQLVVTAHNPAILDGLDLNDEQQRLLVVSRDSQGATRLSRVKAPRSGRQRMRLSEAFTRGLLGGLPKGF